MSASSCVRKPRKSKQLRELTLGSVIKRLTKVDRAAFSVQQAQGYLDVSLGSFISQVPASDIIKMVTKMGIQVGPVHPAKRHACILRRVVGRGFALVRAAENAVLESKVLVTTHTHTHIYIYICSYYYANLRLYGVWCKTKQTTL